MERTPKERLYWLLRLYKDKEIEAETFCDEFHSTYDHDLDEELTETERVLFKEIAAVTARFSPFEEDHKKYPGMYFTIEDVERVVTKWNRVKYVNEKSTNRHFTGSLFNRS